MDDNITRIVVRYTAPVMQIFGLYIIFHGHLSPGGGFAGGIILGVAMILFALVYGLESGLGKLSHDIAFILIGIGGMLEGIKFLLPHHSGPVGQLGSLFSGGILTVVTFGIGLLVASTVVSVFYLLVEEE